MCSAKMPLIFWNYSCVYSLRTISIALSMLSIFFKSKFSNAFKLNVVEIIPFCCLTWSAQMRICISGYLKFVFTISTSHDETSSYRIWASFFLYLPRLPRFLISNFYSCSSMASLYLFTRWFFGALILGIIFGIS